MNNSEESEIQEVHICLLILIGIPGSGKTELCKLIKRKFEQLHVLHICYDDLILNEVEWRKARDDILVSVKSQLEQFNHGENILVLIDDNMYYKSMRRMYHKLAKKQGYSVCQLYVECDKNIALERIKSRQQDHFQVTKETVERIEKRLEVPDCDEILTLKVNTNAPNFQYHLDVEKPVLTAVQELVLSAFEKSRAEVPKRSHDIEPQAQSSPLQELDIALRKSISLEIQKALNGTQDLKLLGAKLNRERKSLLKIASQNPKFSLPDIVKDFETKFT